MAREEKEIKILLKIPIDTFLSRIESNGFKFTSSVNQTDIYFDTKESYLYENIAAIRLRQIESEDKSFSFKKVFCFPNRENKFFVEEIETDAPFENLRELNQIMDKVKIPKVKMAFKSSRELTKYLAEHGYYDDQKMPKTRKVYEKNGNQFVIDKIENVGTLVELESKMDNPMDVVEEVLKIEEWTRTIEGTSNIWLKNVKGKTSHLTNIQRFESEPDWNVWKNERQWYQKLRAA